MSSGPFISSGQFRPAPVHDALRGESHVMGTLRSTKTTGGVVLWKKHFWVVNNALARLEYYKNDQSINPKGVIDARQIVNVSADYDKQSKFFYLSLKLREKKVREFRMNSVAERDRWHEAVLQLMRSIKSTDRIQALVSALQQRVTHASKELGICISVADIANVPSDLLPFCSDALDSGLDLVRAIAGSKSQGLARLDGVTLSLRKGEDAAHAAGTHYDPSLKRLTVAISIFVEGSGSPTFRHIDSRGALNLLSSGVWRDPSIEGWTTLDRASKLERERIAQLLHIDDFRVSLQWSSDVGDASGPMLTQYLAENVSASLLAQVYALILDICRADDDEAAVKSPLSAALTAGAAPPRITAADCIRQHVTGISVLLDSASIEAQVPPSLVLTHTMWEHAHFLPAFAITSLYRQSRSQPVPKDAIDDLRMQLREVILHVRIATTCRTLEEHISRTLEVRDGATVNWEKLIAALQAIGACDFPERSIPEVVHAMVMPYATRTSRLVGYLKRSGQFETPFKVCIASCRLGFKTPADGGIVTPSVFRGAFSECAIVAHGSTDAGEAAQLGEGDPLRITTRDIDIVIVFPTAFLSSWFSGYFSHPSNLVPAPSKVEDEGDDSDEEDGDAYGENVAAERSGETRILSVRDVVNAVYDSQGTDLQLMASAEVISAGVDSLQRAFSTVTISKHDLVRLLSHSLRRLRALAHAVGSGTLSLEQANGVLRTFCEYPESEKKITDAVRAAVEASESAKAGSPTTPAPVEGAALRYQSLARIALSELLPIDVVLAMKSRRDVLLIGLENTGKTLIQNLLRSVVRPTYPTIGVTECIVAYREWALNFKELGGRSELRKNWRQYIPLIGNVHAVVFVVDASATSTHTDAKRFLSDTLSHKSLAGRPVLLLLNNYRGNPDAAIVVEQLQFESVTKKAHQPHCAATCDVTIVQHRQLVDKGLATGLDWLCGALRDGSSPDDTPQLPKDCLAAVPETQ